MRDFGNPHELIKIKRNEARQMAKIAKMQEVAVNELKPYEMNAKRHDIGGISESMKEFGFVSPVLIDKEYNVIAGHGRIEAAAEKYELSPREWAIVKSLGRSECNA